MTTLAVILARAGSVGLTSKHLRLLHGRPVVAYSFDHVLEAGLLSRVVVSTDCPGVKMLARRHGLEVIDRPPQLAGPEASVQDVMLHAMRTVEATGDFVPEALVTVYGNVPVRPAGVIDAAVQRLAETGCDSVRSFCPVGKWHPAWMSRLTEDDVVDAVQAGSIHRRQDLTPLYLHDGAVVAVSRQSMLRGVEFPTDPHAFFGVDRRGVRTEAGATVEVDSLRDLYWAEAVLRDRMPVEPRLAG